MLSQSGEAVTPAADTPQGEPTGSEHPANRSAATGATSATTRVSPTPADVPPPTVTPAAETPEEEEPYDGPPTLFALPPRVGAYGGLTFEYSRIAHVNGLLIGIEACLLLQHRLAFGAAAYAWANETHGPSDADGSPRNLELGYGGVVARYSLLTDKIVYVSGGMVLGAGAATLVREDETSREAGRNDTDTFFVVEPQVSGHTNVTRWMRLTAQVGYRITGGVTRFGYEEGDFNGITLGGGAQFGWL